MRDPRAAFHRVLPATFDTFRVGRGPTSYAGCRNCSVRIAQQEVVEAHPSLGPPYVRRRGANEYPDHEPLAVEVPPSPASMWTDGSDGVCYRSGELSYCFRAWIQGTSSRDVHCCAQSFSNPFDRLDACLRYEPAPSSDWCSTCCHGMYLFANASLH